MIAGNAFLGGFIAGLSASNGDQYEAALYGTVSASFIVEQIGLPKVETYISPLGTIPHVTDGDEVENIGSTIPLPESRSERLSVPGGEMRGDGVENERWNGEVPELRLEILRRRIVGGI